MRWSLLTLILCTSCFSGEGGSFPDAHRRKLAADASQLLKDIKELKQKVMISDATPEWMEAHKLSKEIVCDNHPITDQASERIPPDTVLGHTRGDKKSPQTMNDTYPPGLFDLILPILLKLKGSKK